jgi:hypothetical protein
MQAYFCIAAKPFYQIMCIGLVNAQFYCADVGRSDALSCAELSYINSNRELTMAENESSKSQDMQVVSGSSGAVTPAKTDVMPPEGAKSTSFTITLDEKGGVSISPADKAKKADDKKKMPRGSTVFRHA